MILHRSNPPRRQPSEPRFESMPSSEASVCTRGRTSRRGFSNSRAADRNQRSSPVDRQTDRPDEEDGERQGEEGAASALRDALVHQRSSAHPVAAASTPTCSGRARWIAAARRPGAGWGRLRASGPPIATVTVNRSVPGSAGTVHLQLIEALRGDRRYVSLGLLQAFGDNPEAGPFVRIGTLGFSAPAMLGGGDWQARLARDLCLCSLDFGAAVAR